MTTTPAATPAQIEQLIDDAARQYTSSVQTALALSDQALAALATVPAGRVASPTLRARTLRTRGLALHYGGRHAEGLATLTQALAAVPEGDLAQQSSVLRALSIGCELLGDLDDAVAWATQSLAAARAHGGPRLIADALLSLGVSYSHAGDAAAGLAQFEQVLSLFETEGDRVGCLSVLNNMGINCKNEGRHADSAAHFERALALADALGDAAAGAVVRTNYGETLMLMGRDAEARAAFAETIPGLAASGHLDGEINARVNHGRLLLKLGDTAAAQAELERALQLCGVTAGRNHAARAHLALSELHKQHGRFEEALRHHEAYHAAERAQFNAESDRKIHSLRAQREVADARFEAELHRLKHVEIASAHEELKALHAALVAADDEKNRLLARLEEQSRTDALTGLANRRALDERLLAEMARSRRTAQPLALALCDLDFFKRVNDHFGHATGDEVLRRVATILRERCRATDLVARYGGEEFCLAFIETDAESASRTCEALRAAVAAHDWASVHPELLVTLSMGIADDPHAKSHEQLLASADHQLYRAKHEGKNRVCWRGNERAEGGPE
ncbi:MAG: tetratricopeptide repeat-containing diguanylate cyclase [Burkholderiales bacterium]